MIDKVGVIGAGAMGNGIAHVCALAKLDVTLIDVNEDQLKKAMDTIRFNMERQVKRNLITAADEKAALGRIKTGLKIDVLGDCDMVIEAATEKEAVKKDILKALCPILKPTALLASNTSSISITRLGAVTDRPSKFIGMHFMNPVPVMQLVELIRGLATDDETFTAFRTLAEKLGKTTATSEDFPAFIVNRILQPMINEAIYTLYEGVGTVDSHRHRHASRRQPPDGPAAARRLHRPRRLPRGHAGALRGPGGQQIPPLPAAGEIRRSRLAGTEDRPRLLRLLGRQADPDTVVPLLLSSRTAVCATRMRRDPGAMLSRLSPLRSPWDQWTIDRLAEKVL